MTGLAVDSVGGVAVAVVGASAAGSGITRLEPGGAVRWERPLPGRATRCELWAGAVYAATVGGPTDDAALVGDPGALVLALDDASGEVRWRLSLTATGWAVISAIAADDGGVVVGGSFTGSLRIGDQVVSSAGDSDGFVARLGHDGKLIWLARVGGTGADAVTALASDGVDVAIAGSFAVEAELRGQQLLARVPTSPYADGFVAVMNSQRATVSLLEPFGGADAESVVAVHLDATAVQVVATVRSEARFGSSSQTMRGALATVLAAYPRRGGEPEVRIIDGTGTVRPSAAAWSPTDRWVAGSFDGALALGELDVTADGTDGWLFEIGANVGHAPRGAGREDVSAIDAGAGGLAIAVHHTAAIALLGADAPVPADIGGGTLVIVGPRSRFSR